MWNEYLLDYWSLLVLKYTAALINAFGPSLSWCKLPRLNAAEQIYIIWRHTPQHVGAAAFQEGGSQCATDSTYSTSHPAIHPCPAILGKKGKHPWFLGWFVSCSLCCFACLRWNSGGRVTFGGLHTPQPWCHRLGGLPVPAAPHPWANPTAKVIQCASALAFMGTLWLFCVEHIILMGGNQINSKPHLTSASCEDSGNSVCCIPSSPARGNLLASNACCVQWDSRNQYHFILLCSITTVWIFMKQRTQLKYCLTPHTAPAHVHIDGEGTHLHLQAANCEVLHHNRDCAGI